MNTQTNINAIVAEVNALVKAGEDAKAEERLIASIAEHTEAEPNDPVGQSVLLNELGGFYRSRGAFEKGEKAYLKAAALLKESMLLFGFSSILLPRLASPDGPMIVGACAIV